MAYGIMGNLPDSRLLTYRTTRPVRAVYFDGMSASLMGDGTKSQMVFLYNGTNGIPERGRPGPWKPPGRGGKPGDRPGKSWNPLEDEYFRARELCAWLQKEGIGGRGWGYEGVVRMNAGFEVIWCDFESSSLRLISNLNVSAPRLDFEGLGSDGLVHQEAVGDLRGLRRRSPIVMDDVDEGPHGPGMADPTEPFKQFSNWMWFSAAARRYLGETRVKVDACTLFSFYNPELQAQTENRRVDEMYELGITAGGLWIAPKAEVERDAALQKLTRRRRGHQLDSVNNEDGLIMRNAVNSVIAQEIVRTYGELLRDLRLALQRAEQNDTDLNPRNMIQPLRVLTHWIFLQFLEYPPNRPYLRHDLAILFSPESDTAQNSFERCRNQYATDELRLDGREELLSFGIKDTLSGICSTLVRIVMEVEYVWLLHYNSGTYELEPTRLRSTDVAANVTQWKHQLEELMAWLGWADTEPTCRDGCAPGEICYIPMWPVLHFPRRDRRPPKRPDLNDENNPLGVPDWGSMDRYLWHPTCLNASSYSE